MTPAQTFEVLEKVENMIDSLHAALQGVQKKMQGTGFEGQYQDKIAEIQAQMARLVTMADALRAKTIQQQGGANG